LEKKYYAMRTIQIKASEFWRDRRVFRKSLKNGIVIVTTILVSSCDSKDSLNNTDGKDTHPVLIRTSSNSPPDRVGSEATTDIPTLVSTYSGEELEARLQQLGKEIAASGDIEACIEFWANLPPGEMSGRAFSSSIHRLVRSNPHAIFEKLDEIRNTVPEIHILNALIVAATSFAERGEAIMALTRVREDSRLTEEERTMFAEEIVRRVGSSNPAELGQLLELIPAGASRDKIVLEELNETALDFIGLTKPAELKSIVKNLGEPAQNSFVEKLAGHFGRIHPNEALTTLPALLPPKLQMPYMVKAFQSWSENDLNSALDWVSSCSDTKIRDELVAGSISNISNWDTEAAKKWADSISDIGLRTQAISEIELRTQSSSR
jgi:hypothetical protein